MDLRFDFSRLWSEVKRLTDNVEPFSIAFIHSLDSIDVALSEKGIEVDLGELDSLGYLLTYKGRQVLLYIPDHGTQINDVLSGDNEGKKFHVAHCRTLEQMRMTQRFERYVATTKLDGVFSVTGMDKWRSVEVQGEARLLVCKNCLSKLNYKQSKLSPSLRNRVRDEFDISEFFETYSSFFPHIPKRDVVEKGSGAYSQDWKEVSETIRAAANWTCSHCRINLSDYKNLLHVHHIDGRKDNNSPENLRPLCAACHREQPLHSAIFVKREEMQVITAKRREVGSLTPDWDSLMIYADPALRGVIGLARSRGLEPPEAGFRLPDGAGVLDLAWPWRKEAIVIELGVLPLMHGWKIRTLAEAISWLE